MPENLPDISNDGETTLAASINDSVIEIPLTSFVGTRLPTDTTNAYITVITVESFNTLAEVKETMQIESVSGNIVTVLRDVDNTGALSFDAGAIVEVRNPAQVLDEYKSVIRNILSDQDNIIYVSKVGDDLNNGLNINNSKLTIGSAITEAINLIPAISLTNQVVIKIFDGAEYVEDFELPSFVHLSAVDASIRGSITVNDSCVVKARKVHNPDSGSNVINKNSGSGSALVDVTVIDVSDTGNQTGVRCNSGFIDIRCIYMQVDGNTGVEAKSGSTVDINLTEILLINGALGLGTRSGGGSGSFIVGLVLKATDDGTGTLIESKQSGDVTDVYAGSLNVNTLADLGSGSTLNVATTEAVGITNIDPAATFHVLDVSGDSFLGGKVNGVDIPESDKHSTYGWGTGLIYGGNLTINADPTKFDLEAGVGYVIDSISDPENPTSVKVSWPTQLGITPTSLNSASSTNIAIDINGDIVEKTSGFNSSERRVDIILGGVSHVNRTDIDDTFMFPVSIVDVPVNLLELYKAVGVINLDGNVFKAYSNALQICKTSGEYFAMGENFNSDPYIPNRLFSPTQEPIGSFSPIIDNGSGEASFLPPSADIDPNNIDGGLGALVPISNNKWQIKRLWEYPNSNRILVQYGEKEYRSSTEALVGIDIDPVSNFSAFGTASLRGWLVVQEGATDLSTQATFLVAGKFGETGNVSSGATTTTLQNAYDNSVAPQFLIDLFRGAVEYQGATGDDTDEVLRIRNNAGAETAYIRADGTIVSTNKLTATDGTFNGGMTVTGDLDVSGEPIGNLRWVEYIKPHRDIIPDTTLTGTGTEILEQYKAAQVVQWVSILLGGGSLSSRFVADVTLPYWYDGHSIKATWRMTMKTALSNLDFIPIFRIVILDTGDDMTTAPFSQSAVATPVLTNDLDMWEHTIIMPPPVITSGPNKKLYMWIARDSGGALDTSTDDVYINQIDLELI